MKRLIPTIHIKVKLIATTVTKCTSKLSPLTTAMNAIEIKHQQTGTRMSPVVDVHDLIRKNGAFFPGKVKID